MATLVFDIETSAQPIENFDEAQQEYLFRETEKIDDAIAKNARRDANQQYVEWLGFFGSPSDKTSIPAAVTKDILREALAKQGVEIKKSGTKKEMIEKARGIPGLLSALIVQAYPQQRELLSEWKGLVNDWALRVRYVEAVGRALFKIMAIKGLK